MNAPQDQLPPRGSFPKGPRGEAPAQRRERYEQWLIDTAASAKAPDHELHAVLFYRGKNTSVSVSPGSTDRKLVPKQPSPGLCATARCWQCMAGPDEVNVQDEIAACPSNGCGLHPVRPYQVQAQARGRAAAKAAVKRYCLDCAGGSAHEVRHCPAASCAIWAARPYQLAESGRDPEGSGQEAAQ